ncbi:MAG: hypothetical protein EA351_00905 [Gemmatimonadales bacterium]|nr:MAG: hypothetical protein EA351_00905 [Gemmatimonadales bacterium]
MSPRPGNAALAGNRVPRRHRFYLSDGRILTGDLYRSPNSRLADHVASLKGYIAVVDAKVEIGEPGQSMDFIALNSAHVLFIEELEGDS